jgi:nucleotide-binding universal stress UspA family protein
MEVGKPTKNQSIGAGMKILIGYDGSEESKKALDIVKHYAKILSAEALVLTVVEGGAHAVREVYQKAENDLTFAKNSIAAEGIRCTAKLSAQGLEPGEDLLQFAEENAIDLIIIGIQKRSKMGKLLFGSNAQYVILNAACPVLTVK